MTHVPKKRTIAILSFVALGFMVTSLALKVFLNGVEPWSWMAAGFQGLAVVIGVLLLVRVVRGQRDDYWRERGKGTNGP
ncbi:hypothetical protein ACX80D_03825 [Arthrobacter sp. Sr24]